MYMDLHFSIENYLQKTECNDFFWQQLSSAMHGISSVLHHVQVVSIILHSATLFFIHTYDRVWACIVLDTWSPDMPDVLQTNQEDIQSVKAEIHEEEKMMKDMNSQVCLARMKCSTIWSILKLIDTLFTSLHQQL